MSDDKTPVVMAKRSVDEAYETSWTTLVRIPRALSWTCYGLVALGVVSFVNGLYQDTLRVWQSYLVNFLFWGGLAQGAVVFSAIYHVVEGRWGPPVRRLSEGMVAFLPVSFVLFLPLYGGFGSFFSLVRELNPDRGAWFDPRFIFVRGGLSLGLMTVLSCFYFYYSVRPEVGWALARKLRPRSWFYGWLVEDWQGEQLERVRCQRGMNVLATALLVAYPLTYSFMAFDLIMALDPFWYSSLFGGYFFISTFYLGLAGLAVVAGLIRLSLRSTLITSAQLSDLGNLLLGFNLTYIAMIWSQYIVIWYGNLPEETHFVVLRVWQKPWALLSWTVLATSVLIPFLIFLSQPAKRSPSIMLMVGLLIGAGLWIERFVLVIPSLWSQPEVPFGWIEAGLTLGFFGAAGLSYFFFLENFALLPFVESDPLEATDIEANLSRG